MKNLQSSRRYFLKATGATLALPFLDSLRPGMLGSGIALGESAIAAPAATRRLVAIGNLLGFVPKYFFPTESGRDYAMTRLLKPLEQQRNDFTVYSGLDHGIKGGHFAVHSFLSGVLKSDAKAMPNGNISIDQFAAESIRGQTRFSSLAVGSEKGLHGGCQMVWTRSGTRVPPISGPRELFKKLFVDESADRRKGVMDRFSLKDSILDTVAHDAKSLGNRLSGGDRDKLDEYFTSIREVEQQLQLDREWATVSKPDATIEEPTNANLVDDLPLLYDLIVLALQTDSTRIATLEIGGDLEPRHLGVKGSYHGLSHHGHETEKLEGLLTLEEYQMKQFSRFLTKLKSISDGDANLLDHTSVLLGSGISNANSHTNGNLPIIVAGGGYAHGEHKAVAERGPNHRPLSHLFTTLLQDFGVEGVESFAGETGTFI